MLSAVPILGGPFHSRSQSQNYTSAAPGHIWLSAANPLSRDPLVTHWPQASTSERPKVLRFGHTSSLRLAALGQHRRSRQRLLFPVSLQSLPWTMSPCLHLPLDPSWPPLGRYSAEGWVYTPRYLGMN